MEQTSQEKAQGKTEPKTQNSEQSHRKVMALLAYLGILVFIPLLVDRDDPFVKYHTKQGIVLLIAWVILSGFGMIPILGWILAPILSIILFILMIIGIINALGEKEKPLPILGQFATKFEI